MRAAAVDAVRPGFRIAFSRASIPAAPPTRAAGQPSTEASGRTTREAFSATPRNSKRQPPSSEKMRTPVARPCANTP